MVLSIEEDTKQYINKNSTLPISQHCMWLKLPDPHHGYNNKQEARITTKEKCQWPSNIFTWI